MSGEIPLIPPETLSNNSGPIINVEIPEGLQGVVSYVDYIEERIDPITGEEGKVLVAQVTYGADFSGASYGGAPAFGGFMNRFVPEFSIQALDLVDSGQVDQIEITHNWSALRGLNGVLRVISQGVSRIKAAENIDGDASRKGAFGQLEDRELITVTVRLGEFTGANKAAAFLAKVANNGRPRETIRIEIAGSRENQ